MCVKWAAIQSWAKIFPHWTAVPSERGHLEPRQGPGLEKDGVEMLERCMSISLRETYFHEEKVLMSALFCPGS